jgi:endonuclease-3
MDFHKLFSRLKKRFPEAVFNGPRDPFSVLISTIISQRTRDEQTYVAAQSLLSAFPTVKDMAEADAEDIEQLIRPAGFFRVKARKIKEVCAILVSEYKGSVPDDYDSLIKLPSVGQKTANCVLVFGYGKEAIPVDTHVHRISNRLAIVKTKSPEETEQVLRNILPKKYWLDINLMFVQFGRTICKPIGPKCKTCQIFELCSWSGKSK